MSNRDDDREGGRNFGRGGDWDEPGIGRGDDLDLDGDRSGRPDMGARSNRDAGAGYAYGRPYRGPRGDEDYDRAADVAERERRRARERAGGGRPGGLTGDPTLGSGYTRNDAPVRFQGDRGAYRAQGEYGREEGGAFRPMRERGAFRRESGMRGRDEGARFRGDADNQGGGYGYGDFSSEGRRVADAQGYTYGPGEAGGAPSPRGGYAPPRADEDAIFGADPRLDYYDEENRGLWERASDEVASWFGDEGAERRRGLDAARAGKSGRGPKGYRRSDERIREDVSDRLTDDDYLDASDIEVSVDAGVVTLSGTVDDRQDKRRAEDLAERVSGVTDVLNRIRVGRGAVGATITGVTGTGATGTPAPGTATTVSPTNAGPAGTEKPQP